MMTKLMLIKVVCLTSAPKIHLCFSLTLRMIKQAKLLFHLKLVRLLHVRDKDEDDNTPLPQPFPLPKHYRLDVERALASGKMTKDTTCAFLSAVAAAMLVYKQYPSKSDYVNVSRSVVEKYSFFSSPAGTPYVSDHLASAC